MFFTTYTFPEGKLLLVKSGEGLILAHYLRNPDAIEKALKPLHDRGMPLEHKESRFTQEKRLFDRYFDGKPESFDALPLDLSLGTHYQQRPSFKGSWQSAQSRLLWCSPLWGHLCSGGTGP